MTKFLSGRQKNLKIGITSYSENTQVLEVIGRVGIGSTIFSASYDLDVRGTSRFSGNVTLGANLYPDTDGLYDVGRAPNRWKDANFLGKGTFGTGVSAHDIEIGVGAANLIYSTSGNLELNSTSGTTNIDDIVTISGNLGIGTVNPQQKLWVEGNGYFSGILTAQRIISSLYGEFFGGSISGTNIVGTALSISGISTFSDGPVLIGGGTSTGTAGQILQVSGINSSVYIGGNLGIGVTNPTSALQVNGRIYSGNNISTSNISNTLDKNIGTGYRAERSFNLVDTSAAVKIVRTNDNSGPVLDLHHWNAGITTMLSYWDIASEKGTFSIRDRIGNYTNTKPEVTRLFINSYGNVLLGASNNTVLENITESVGYGTANILQVNGNSYLGGFVGIGTTTPTSRLWVGGNGYFTGVVTATTFIGNLSGTATTATNLSNAANITTGTIDKDRLLNSNSFSVLGDLYVSNNISFGGTTTQLNLQQLQIVDADIVLGIGTSFSPTDNTANHGGIAIASTEGSPLVSLNIVPGETNPSTYKKIMWFKGDTIGAGLTDAWLFNYGVGIGSTQIPNGVRLAAGGMQVTDSTISTPNLNVTGVGTFLSSGIKIRNPANTFQYNITGGAIVADRTLNLPVITATDTVAVLGLSQTWAAAQSFTSTVTISGTLNVTSANINHTATVNNFTAASYTTGTVTIGGPNQTGAITVGQATTSQTLNLATGVSLASTTKTINFGTGGASGSFTQINIGPTAGVGTVTINSGTNLGIGTTTPTSALTVVGNVLVSGVSTLGITTTTNLTAQQLNISGITTVGFLTATNISVSGIVTSNAYYIGTTQVISSARQLQNIASLDATTTATIESAITNAPNTFTDLQVTGVSTFTNGPVLIGTGTSTGTASQPLQVTGGAYVSGNLGIGTTNPQSALDIRGAITVGVGTVGINSITSTTDIQSWYYTNKSKLVSGEDASSQAIYVGAAGTAMFMVGDSGNDVNQYTLSTPYDVSTAGASIAAFSVATQETGPLGIDFNPTGTKMFISGNVAAQPGLIAGGEYVHEYSLSTAWTVSSAGYTTSFNVTQDTAPQGVTFGNSGSKMYVVGSAYDTVYQYSLSTPYSLASGVTYDNISLILGTNPLILETAPTDISFNSAGTVLWVIGSANDRIYEFRLGTAWDISTAVFYADVYVGFNETVATGLQVIPEQNVAYIIGSGNDTIYQYSTNTPTLQIASSGISSVSSIVLNNETRVKDKLYVKGNTHIDGNTLTQGTLQVDGASTLTGNVTASGTLAVTSTLTGNAAVTFDATASNINLGTSQVSGTIILGGTSQTSAITLGRATTSQTTNIQAGVTASGNTKTINFGTGGASGSRTLITVGSATAGAASTVFIPSPTNLLIGTATTTGTASQRLQVDGGAYVSGNLGIGTTNPTSTLHVVGDTYISGILTATDINSASDIRLKTNIKPFENTLEKIVHINGVSFNWIDSNAKSGGIIAQDVEKVFPELVNDGDHKTVNYNGLVGVLVESIKELKQEVEYLKSRLS